MNRRIALLLFLFTCAICFAAEPEKAAGPIQPVRDARLQNAYRFAAGIFSGAQPENDAAFQALADLKVKTIVSVDGARPDVARAEKFGMRYVHIPFGYDGIAAHTALELARAVRDLPGAVFIHCHHGKHRSPAATAIACVLLGKMSAGETVTALKTAGTGAEYPGLYAAAANATLAEKAALDAVAGDFPSVGKLPPLAETMVVIDGNLDRLKRLAEEGWTTPPSHPDLDPAHEALQLRERFHELQRMEEIQKKPEDFTKLLGNAEKDAAVLESSLREWKQNGGSPIPPGIGAAFKTLGESCNACHQEYRNRPRK